MRVIETVVYEYHELSEEAQAKARDWYREGSEDYSWAYECTTEDASQIGLKIHFLSQREPNSGEFMKGAEECAKAILANHGPDCETYKTAKAFLGSLESLEQEYGEPNEDGERVSSIDGKDNYDDEREELEKEFLHAILEDYRVMYDKDCEYRDSDEAVAESIEANGYTFTESGKREG